MKWFIYTKVHFGGSLSAFVVDANLVDFLELRRSQPCSFSKDAAASICSVTCEQPV